MRATAVTLIIIAMLSVSALPSTAPVLLFSQPLSEYSTRNADKIIDVINPSSPSDVGSRGDSSSWILETVDSVQDVGYYPSIDIDSSGMPHISYKDMTNSDLKYAKWTGDAWHLETVDHIGNYRGKTSIAVDSNGYPHIAYSTAAGLKYARWTGSVWEKVVVDYGSFPSIAIDSLGRPYISYWNDISDDLKCANWTGSIWNIEVADSDGDVGAYTSLALDSNDHPHISYTEWKSTPGQYNLKYAKWTGGSWVAVTVDSQGNVGKASSIALDSKGYPHISYTDDSLQDLKYAEWSGVTWSIETVDTECVDSTSIALDENDHPHIGFWSHPDNDLAYIKWTGDTWEKQIVDSDGDVGHFQSLALDPNGNPHIGYCDLSNFDLKYARMVNMEVNSLSILDPEPLPSDIYARYRPYTFCVNVTDTVSSNDMVSVLLTLDPLGSDIQLLWSRTAGCITKPHDTNDCLSLESSRFTYNDIRRQWSIEFNVTFNWNYPDEDFHDVSVRASSDLLPDAWLNLTDAYRVENDLTFTGGLTMEDGGGIMLESGDLVAGGEVVTLGGLVPVYEGTTDVYPPAAEYDVAVWDEGGFREDCDPTPGEAIDLDFVVGSATDAGLEHRVNITGIPPDCDASDVTFELDVDGDNVTFSAPTPPETEWQTGADVEVGVTVTDSGGAMVNGGTVECAVSKDNGTTWGPWRPCPAASAVSVAAALQVSLAEGPDNLVRWQASDTLGNGPAQSPAYRVPVDTAAPAFADAFPGPGDISSSDTVLVAINVTDATSGVDPATVEFSASKDGGSSWGPWLDPSITMGDGFVHAEVEYEFGNGTGNRVRWRASDVAGNGPEASPHLTVAVDDRVPPSVGLLFPVDELVIVEFNPVLGNHTTGTLLEWELLSGASSSGSGDVVYKPFLDTVNPPVEQFRLPTGPLRETSVLVGDLKDDTTYYWTVVPVDKGLEGVCEDGVWSFTFDLPDDSAPPPEYGVRVETVDVVEMFAGDVRTVEVNVTNTGDVPDTFRFSLDTGELGTRVSLPGQSELAVAAGATVTVQVTVSLAAKDIPAGEYAVTFTAVSLGALAEGRDVSDNATFGVILPSAPNGNPDGEDEEDDDKGGQDMSAIYVVALVAALIAAVLLLLVMRSRKKRKEVESDGAGDPAPSEGQAIAVDIIKPGKARPKGPVRLTPAPVVDAGGGPQAGGAPLTAAGGLSMRPAATSGAAPGLPTAPAGAGVGTLPADRLLPKAPRPTKPVGPKEDTGDPLDDDDEPSAGPATSPKPATPGVIAPKEPARKAEVYHEDSGAVWTPDMATQRTAREAESAVEMLPKLKKMLDDGVLTREEYEVHKRRLLRKL